MGRLLNPYFLLHKEVGRSTQRVVRVLNLGRLSVLGRIHQVLRSMIGVEVAMHRMARQITSSSAAVLRTPLLRVTLVIRRASRAVTFTGLTHGAIVSGGRTIAP